ncbi:putative P450 monooxygenase [Pleomassaria siparia CBS 279.74]|uniref:Putative P450 monooxygenase n=1 Tax=Pleomassaria siparia CBS 279.74 TaxID=1314801 RepID=A0A6G1KM55_9PLEO|nr:putative P450 monooxygenase [Pleomassaria siparia CBS 279.74]
MDSTIIAFAGGVATHLLYYKQYEFHEHPFRNVQGFLLAIAGMVVIRVHYLSHALSLAVRSSLFLTAISLTGIYTSLVVYRLFFNPLNNTIPGPYWARLTKFNAAIRNRKIDGHRQLLALHKKYGRFVRLGPNDISVTDPDGVQVVNGHGSKCIKAPWYDAEKPRLSMHTTRDPSLHGRRRRIWAPGFSDKALRGYESRIKVYNDLLISKLCALSGTPVNAAKWFNLYSFDVMGDLGFGESFGMIERGEEHWAIALLNAGMDPMGLWLPSWAFRAIVTIPGATKDYFRFIHYCCNQIDARIKKGKDAPPDIAGYLVDSYLKSENKRDALSYLEGDSRLIVVAGSDTTAATLTYLFTHLASRPDAVERLRKDLGPLMTTDGGINHADIQNLEFLNGCINETLRMDPPVPAGVFRQTPKEGIHIGDKFIAGNTVIQMPGYVMGRDIYPQPHDFIPERWYSRPELILHKDAFQPFSSGPFGCIGKNLGLMEIRTLTARLVTLFDIEFAPGENGDRLKNETTEHFTLGLAPVDLVFKMRT